MEQLFMDGVEILYSTHYVNIGMKIATVLLVVAWVGVVVVPTVIMISEKDANGWEIVLIAAIFIGFSVFGCFINSKPYTVYHVRIDDSVPYTYITNNFSNVEYEGGDCYKIMVKDK